VLDVELALQSIGRDNLWRRMRMAVNG